MKWSEIPLIEHIDIYEEQCDVYVHTKKDFDELNSFVEEQIEEYNDDSAEGRLWDDLM